MPNWPEVPSPRASAHELADYAELFCWKEENTSLTALSRALGRLDENDYPSGVPEDEPAYDKAEQAFAEIERRREVCKEGYPFAFDPKGLTLQFASEYEDFRHEIYRYLLLATRLNMRDNRVHAEIDGALLFERLAAEIARNYFGTHARSLVFGTASGEGSFEAKVNNLCYQLGEGVGYSRSDSRDQYVRDGKLDVVVWKPFADKLEGQLIGFGQCKTGTSYGNELTSLQPDTFCRNWLIRSPVVPPIRMFFVAEALMMSLGHRATLSANTGLLFDRCRIIEYSGEVDGEVLSNLRDWTNAAKAALLTNS